MDNSSLFAKGLWVLYYQGFFELLKRSFRYLRKHKLYGLLSYRNRIVNYNMWLAKEVKRIKVIIAEAEKDISSFRIKPKVSIIMPVWNTELEYLDHAIKSVCNQVYPFWELCVVNDNSDKVGIKELLLNYKLKDKRIKVKNLTKRCGVVGASNIAIDLADGEFIGFLDHDDELAPHALLQVVRLLNKNPELDLIYSDEDRIIGNMQRCDPFFKPDWSPDLLLSMNYIGHFLVARSKLIKQLGGLRSGTEGSQDYDLVLRITEKTNRIAHIPEILYHWRMTPGSITNQLRSRINAFDTGRYVISDALKRRGLKGEVIQVGDGRYRVSYQLEGNPLVSIIIPTRDKVALLQMCISSILEKSSYKNYEIIVVDNESQEIETIEYFDLIQKCKNCKIIAFKGRFNYSKINNFAVRQAANGEYIVFLNNDTEVISQDWLEEMLRYAQQKRIGAVGAKLLFRNNTIQHGGVIVGLGGVAGHAFYGLPASEPGYMDLATVTRNCAAVTGACMMLRRAVFEEVGGFDEELDVAYNDVDLCLRIIQRGYYIVWTPHAVLYHHESATRGQYQPERNIRYFCEKWRRFLEEGDPFYNPNLALDRSDYMVKV